MPITLGNGQHLSIPTHDDNSKQFWYQPDKKPNWYGVLDVLIKTKITNTGNWLINMY